jgi:site-specific recombinase XerD
MNIGKYCQMYSKDLELKNYAKNTIDNYVSQVALFLKYHEKVANKPSEINEKQIKSWLLQAKSINGRKHRLSAVKLFYKLTGKQPLKFKHIEYPRSNPSLPKVIDRNLLLTKIGEIKNLKHKAIIAIAYSVGLRVSEVINLKIKDIDSNQMLIFIHQAKGNKDRVVPMSQFILDLLRDYVREYRPKEYLFNGQDSLQYTSTSCNAIVKQYLGKEYHFHLLRHSSFTTMLENGTDLRIIQKIAGHANIKTTTIYTHVSNQILHQVKTAL